MTSFAYRQFLEYRDSLEYGQELQRLLGKKNTMNERIKELAEQAGIDLYGDTGVEATQANLQEFAELIVARCCEIVHRKTDNSIGIVTSIEDYFGVE